MPPQQAERLLDFRSESADLGAHDRLPLFPVLASAAGDSTARAKRQLGWSEGLGQYKPPVWGTFEGVNPDGAA
jgi:hypothetical protein